jgi:hypothetical protein
LTDIPGVTFDEAWSSRIFVTLDTVTLPMIGKAQLIENQRAVGRSGRRRGTRKVQGIPSRQSGNGVARIHSIRTPLDGHLFGSELHPRAKDASLAMGERRGGPRLALHRNAR